MPHACYEHLFQQGVRKLINIWWLPLDSCSTVDVFYNVALLQSIRLSKTSLRIHSTGGITRTNLIGDLPGYGKVRYDGKGIANSISMALADKKDSVTEKARKGFEVILEGVRV